MLGAGEIFRIVLRSKFRCRVNNSSPLGHILSQFNIKATTSTTFFNTHFNIIPLHFFCLQILSLFSRASVNSRRDT